MTEQVVNPLLSIVTTSYSEKRLKDIFKLLDSISAQTYPNIEITLVIDHLEELQATSHPVTPMGIVIGAVVLVGFVLLCCVASMCSSKTPRNYSELPVAFDDEMMSVLETDEDKQL